MGIRIGYACVNTKLAGSGRTTRLSNATPERLLELSRANLEALQDILTWNLSHDITLFRISSGVIPFGSHPVNQLPWWDLLEPELEAAGQLVRAGGMRVSMHPGQYTVLNSPRPEVVQASVEELVYHTRLLDSLALDASHKIILHAGGVYGEKSASMQRFTDAALRLPDAVRARLVLENDEKNYTLAEVLSLAGNTGLPVVFDVFHHAWNPSYEGEPLRALIERASRTWGPESGRQKVHYSNQWPGKPPGSHSESVDQEAFAEFYAEIQDLELDVMIEVKDKEQSVLALYDRIPALKNALPT